MSTPARTACEPAANRTCPMGCVVVHQVLDYENVRHVILNAVQEAKERLGAVAAGTLADYFARRSIECPETRSCAVALVIMRTLYGLSRRRGCTRWSART